MLKVTNGVLTVTVTKGAFESYFKHAGYSIVNLVRSDEESGVGSNHPTPDSPEDEETTQEEIDEVDEDPDDEVDYSEIPLGELSFDQLIDYADQLKIEHRGIRSKKELRAAIREYLNWK